MENNKIYLSNLTEGVLDRHIPIADSLSQLMSPDPVRATRSIIRLAEKTLLEFETYLPMKKLEHITISEEKYTFPADNYEDYYKGKSDKLYLQPIAIASALSGSYALTANYWRYEGNTFIASPGDYNLRCYCRYPFYKNLDQNGLPMSDCHIFGIDSNVINQFYNLFDLNILTTVQSRSKLINLPFTVDFLNLAEDIQQLREDVDSDKMSSASLYYRWV